MAQRSEPRGSVVGSSSQAMRRLRTTSPALKASATSLNKLNHGMSSHLELHVMHPRQVQVLSTSKGTSDADELETIKSEDDF